jgi:hypothetical protein
MTRDLLSARKREKTVKAAAKKLRRERRESRARREAEWFYKVLRGRVPEEGTASPEVRSAAAQIEAWLKAVPAFHRGALSLRYRRRPWPAAIVRQFGGLSSLAIRLECALHPATGKTNEELEKAAIERIEKTIAAREAAVEEIKAITAQNATCSAPTHMRPRGEDPPLPADVDIARLDYRAERHVALAIRALGKVRGDAPCVLPRAKPRVDQSVTPVTEPRPSSSVRLAAPAVEAPSSSVHLAASVTDPSPVAGSETEDEDEDPPSSREVRRWH